MSLYAYEISENGVGVLPTIEAFILINDAVESLDSSSAASSVVNVKPSLVIMPSGIGVTIITGGNSDYFPTGYNYN